MRASEIRAETYPREEQSLNRKIRATKLVWFSLYSSPSIKQQIWPNRSQRRRRPGWVSMGRRHRAAAMRKESTVPPAYGDSCCAQFQSSCFRLIPLFSHLKRGANTPNRDHPESFVTAVFTVIFQLFVRAFYAVALSAFVQLYERPFPQSDHLLDREIHLSSYRIYLHSSSSLHSSVLTTAFGAVSLCLWVDALPR